MPRKKVELKPGDTVVTRSPLYRQYSADELDDKKIKRIVTLTNSSSVAGYPDYIQILFRRKKNRKRGLPFKIVELIGGIWVPLSVIKYKYKEHMKKNSNQLIEQKLRKVIRKEIKSIINEHDNIIDSRVEMHESRISNKWLYTIKIKDTLDNESSLQSLGKIAERCIRELGVLFDKIKKSNIVADDKDLLTDDIERVIVNMEFIRDLSSGNISEDEWDDYSITDIDDIVELLDDYLGELYDIADRRVDMQDGTNVKFLWVG